MLHKQSLRTFLETRQVDHICNSVAWYARYNSLIHPNKYQSYSFCLKMYYDLASVFQRPKHLIRKCVIKTIFHNTSTLITFLIWQSRSVKTAHLERENVFSFISVMSSFVQVLDLQQPIAYMINVQTYTFGNQTSQSHSVIACAIWWSALKQPSATLSKRMTSFSSAYIFNLVNLRSIIISMIYAARNNGLMIQHHPFTGWAFCANPRVIIVCASNFHQLSNNKGRLGKHRLNVNRWKGQNFPRSSFNPY